eukprot:jgi/Botrbrau1/10464/Bobra.0133s0070.1
MCYTTGNLSDLPRPCSPARPGTRVSFQQLIQAGQGMDQKEGSICTALATNKPDSYENLGYKGIGCEKGLNCVAIGGPFNGTEYGYCRREDVEVVAAPTAALNISSVSFAVRSTTLGSACRLPLIYKGRLVTDCQPLTPGASGQECFVRDASGPQPCNTQGGGGPLVHLATWLNQAKLLDKGEGALCVIPAPDAASPCDTGLQCRTLPPGTLDTTTYGYCTSGPGYAPAPIPQPVAKMMVATRTTTQGVPCRLPLYFQGQLMLDCLAVNGTASCAVEGSDTLVPCSPKLNFTTDVPLDKFISGVGSDGKEGSICPLAPLPGETTVHTVCLPGLRCNAAKTGLLAGSGFGYCSSGASTVPAVSKTMNDITVARRTSASGLPCRLPVIYQGQMVTDCKVFNESQGQVCFVEGLNPEACASDSPPQLVGLADLLSDGKGADGGPGSLCLPRGTNLARNASAMPPCTAPLTCIVLEPPMPGLPIGYGFCGNDTTTDEAVAAAAALPAVAPTTPLPGAGTDSIVITPRLTTTQAACRLPVVFHGKLLTNCINEAGIELCFIEGLERTAPCGPAAQTNTTLTEMLNSATASDGGDGALCQLTPPPSGSTLPCANPSFACTKFEEGPLVGTSFGYCSAAGFNGSTFKTPNSYLSTLMLSNRTTLDGASCRLPIVHMGQLYVDCMHVNDVLRCYVLGDPGPPRDCAPQALDAPPISTAAMIAANGSVDGLEGSLCTLGALGDPNGDVFACVGNLTCRQFPGPLTSAGYGYCEVPLDVVGAGALYVAPPAQHQKQCGPRCIGGALLGSVAALAAVTAGAYLYFRRPSKGRGAQPFGGAFSRFNNAPTGSRPISSLDAAVNGSLHSNGSAGIGGMSTLPPEGHEPPQFSSPFAAQMDPPGGGGIAISRLPSTQLSTMGSMARQPSAVRAPSVQLPTSSTMARAQSMSKWAQSRQGSLISPQFLDQYVAPDAPVDPEKKS